MKRPLGTQGGTGQGHGSQRWLMGRGGGFCGLSTKEKQVEESEREGRRWMRAGGKPSSPWFLLYSSPHHHLQSTEACSGAVGCRGWLVKNNCKDECFHGIFCVPGLS